MGRAARSCDQPRSEAEEGEHGPSSWRRPCCSPSRLAAPRPHGRPARGPRLRGRATQWYWPDPAPQGNDDRGRSTSSAGAAGRWASAGTDADVLRRRRELGSAVPGTGRRRAHGASISRRLTTGLGRSAATASILRTGDGGRHWAPQASGTMRALCLTWPSRTRSTAGRSAGRGRTPCVLATIDGGTHWAPQTLAHGQSAARRRLRRRPPRLGRGRRRRPACSPPTAGPPGSCATSTAPAHRASGPSTSATRSTAGRSTTTVRSRRRRTAARHGTTITQDLATWGLSDVATNGTRVWVATPDGVVLSRDTSAAGVWRAEDAKLPEDLFCEAASGCGRGRLAAGRAAWRSSGGDGDLDGALERARGRLPGRQLHRRAERVGGRAAVGRRQHGRAVPHDRRRPHLAGAAHRLRRPGRHELARGRRHGRRPAWLGGRLGRGRRGHHRRDDLDDEGRPFLAGDQLQRRRLRRHRARRGRRLPRRRPERAEHGRRRGQLDLPRHQGHGHARGHRLR